MTDPESLLADAGAIACTRSIAHAKSNGEVVEAWPCSRLRVFSLPGVKCELASPDRFLVE
jgi:hypothetical protein